MQLLLIENPPYWEKLLFDPLPGNLNTLDVVTNGNDGITYAQSNLYDIILYHPPFSEAEKIHFITSLRQNNIKTPLIFLARDEDTQTIIKALDAGADDYFYPSLSPTLAHARIRALARRNTVYHGNILNYEDLFLNLGTMELLCKEKSMKLGLKESKLCELLLSSPHQILPKNLLIEKIWGLDSDASYNNVEVYISFLRQKLKTLNTHVKIKTVRGVGYQLTT